MNIAILEIGGSHFENIYSLIYLLKDKQATIHLLCNKKLTALLPDKGMVDHLLELPDEFTKKSTQFKTCWQIRQYLLKHKIDCLIIGTVEHRMVRTLSFFLPRINATGIMHNAKKLEKGFTLAHIIFRRVKKFLVFGDFLLSELKPLPKYRVSSFFAILFPQVNQLTVKKPAGDTWVIIPGVVEASRRDYKGFFEELEKTNLPSSTVIILLGYLRPDDAAMHTAIQSLQQQGKKIVHFDHYLSYDDFHSYIQQATVLLPLLETENETFYKDARVSGTVHLGIAYQLPFLLPSTYPNTDIRPYALFYNNNQELVATLTGLPAREDELNKIRHSYTTTVKFDRQQQADKLYEFITRR